MTEYTKDTVITFSAELGDLPGDALKENFTMEELELDYLFDNPNGLNKTDLTSTINKRFYEWLIEATEAGWYVKQD